MWNEEAGMIGIWKVEIGDGIVNSAIKPIFGPAVLLTPDTRHQKPIAHHMDD
jgi:hypothetical protein